MKPAKLLTAFVLLFITTTVFAQKVHYKDNYYTIVKSKIFHRGHDVFGRLTTGERDTIYMIAKELYDQKGKLKAQYKNTRKRDRYKLPEDFWKQKEAAAALAVNATVNKNTPVVVTPPPVAEKTDDKEAIEEKKSSQQQLVANEKENKQHEKTESTIVVAKVAEKEVVKEKNKGDKEVQLKDKIQEQKEEKKANIAERKKEEKQQKEKREKDEKKHHAKKDADERSKAQLKKEQENREEVAPANETKNSKTKKVNNQKNKVEKSRTKETNQAQKSNGKSAQQTKKAENKKRISDKEKNTQSKKQKSLKATAGVLASAGLVNSPLSNDDTFGTVYIKINTEKTSTTKSGDILLFFDVINNSTKDLIILKPNNSMDIRLDFFSNTMECEDIPIKSTNHVAENLKIKEDDYLTIPANSKIELFVNGTYRNWLACNSEDLVLQIQYNPFKNTEEGNELQPPFKKELSKSLKRITPIKIESENIKFKLNKHE